jgi:hypothetical protein
VQERVSEAPRQVGEIMAEMTKKEAYELDELYTRAAPGIDAGRPGVFARQKNMVVELDGLASKCLAQTESRSTA